MKKDNGEDIKVNKRSTDKVYFESTFIQSIYDKIDFLRDESKEILKEIDSTEFKQQLDEFEKKYQGILTEDNVNDVLSVLMKRRGST